MSQQNPKHIAIILDGNRRYAKKHGIPKFMGHEKGFSKIKDVLKWCTQLGIKEVTLYCFSTENFNRDKKEKDYLFNLFRKKFKDFKNDKTIHSKKVKINVIGRISMFPKDMQKAMKDVMEKTNKYNKYKLNLSLAYGSRSEIVDAVNEIIDKGIKKVDEKTITKYLYLPDDVDIFIRPGGEKRVSNFLLWQSSYAELFFIDKLWPEFTKADLIKIIKDFRLRERRFGK